MANKIESEPCEGGRRITRLVSTDRDIVVPDSIDGSAVVAIGPFFLSGSPASDGRTVTVPGTVAEIDRDAFGGIIGIREIAYGGTMEDFCSPWGSTPSSTWRSPQPTGTGSVSSPGTP